MSTRERRGVLRVGRGLDLRLAGAPEQRVEAARPVSRVALLGGDDPGLGPRVVVAEGDGVVRGQALFVDRREPSIRFASPGAGTVVAVSRGEQRRLLSVVVELDEGDRDGAAEAPQIELSVRPSPGLSGDEVEALLLESGLWTALRTRPFGRVARPGARPRSVFVTAMDTSPHAPDLDVALEGEDDALEAGLGALVALGRGAPVRLCVREGSRLGRIGVPGVTVHRFEGPHPAGLAGLHINRLDPVGRGRVAWHAGAQDVAAIGSLMLTGRIRADRVVSLGGAPFRRPRLVRTRLGASIPELVEDEVDRSRPCRLLSGSVLYGHDATEGELAFLGRYHQQVSAVSDERERRLLGWMAPRLGETALGDPLLSRLLPRAGLPLTTSANGEPRPLIPIGRYERCMPYADVVPPLLFRALLTGDLDRAEALGALELVEEDVALCSYVCPSKIDFGKHLREVLAALEKEWP